MGVGTRCCHGDIQEVVWPTVTWFPSGRFPVVRQEGRTWRESQSWLRWEQVLFSSAWRGRGGGDTVDKGRGGDGVPSQMDSRSCRLSRRCRCGGQQPSRTHTHPPGGHSLEGLEHPLLGRDCSGHRGEGVPGRTQEPRGLLWPQNTDQDWKRDPRRTSDMSPAEKGAWRGGGEGAVTLASTTALPQSCRQWALL